MTRYRGTGVGIRRTMRALNSGYKESGSAGNRVAGSALILVTLATGCYEADRLNHDWFGGPGYRRTGKNQSTGPVIPAGTKLLDSNPDEGGVTLKLDNTGNYVIVSQGTRPGITEIGVKFYNASDGTEVKQFENDLAPVSSNTIIPLSPLIRRANSPDGIVVLRQIVYRRKGGEDIEERNLAIQLPRPLRDPNELPPNSASQNQKDRTKALDLKTGLGIYVRHKASPTVNGAVYPVEVVESLFGVADLDPDTATGLIGKAATLDAVREKVFDGSFNDSLKNVYVVLDTTAPGYHIDDEFVGRVSNPVSWVRLGRASGPGDPIRSKIVGALTLSDKRNDVYQDASVISAVLYTNRRLPIESSFRGLDRSKPTQVVESIGSANDLEDWRRTAGNVIAFDPAFDVLQSTVNNPVLTKKRELAKNVLGNWDAARLADLIKTSD